MSIEHRPEYRAAQIQAEADGKLTPEREAYRQSWRDKIAAIIAGRALKDEGIDEPHE